MYQHVKQLGDNNRDCYFLYKGFSSWRHKLGKMMLFVFVIGKTRDLNIDAKIIHIDTDCNFVDRKIFAIKIH